MAIEKTLDDVALRSGVSRATASRALNGRAGVRDDVRDRVVAAAAALGYRPNRAAKNLAGGPTSVIGLVVASEELHRDAYAATLLHAVARAADAHDEGLMLLMHATDPSRAVRNLLSDGLVDGVVVSAVAAGAGWIEELLDAKVPTVLVGAHPRRRDVPVVDTENLESSAAIVGHLLDTGCTRVAIVCGPPDRVDARRRVEGFRLAHTRRGLEVDESLVFSGDFTRPTAYGLADAVLDLHPDGVFAANDETALGLLRRAAERGLTAPGELSVVGFDGITGPSPTGPELTTVVQPFDELADVAVASLLALVRGEPVPTERLLTPTIRLGATTRPFSTPTD